MKKHLFYTFLVIFALTALVILLGVMQIVTIKDEYLKPLSYAFLIELAGAVIAIFNKANFFGDHPKEKNKKTTTQQTNPKNISVKELLKMFDNRLLLETEQLISSELEKVTQSSQEEKEELLIKLYASEKIARFFDQTYSSIFGSQIHALRRLNSHAGSYIKTSEIQKFYDVAKSRYPKIYSVYNFENWVSFLERMALILRKQDSIGITVRGQEFLKYLIDQGLSDNKIG